MTDDDKSILLRLSRNEVKDLIAAVKVAILEGPAERVSRCTELGILFERLLDNEPVE